MDGPRCRHWTANCALPQEPDTSIACDDYDLRRLDAVLVCVAGIAAIADGDVELYTIGLVLVLSGAGVTAGRVSVWDLPRATRLKKIMRRTSPPPHGAGVVILEWLFGVVIEADHLCMSVRGVRAAGASTVTSAVHGLLRDDARTRAEFFALAKDS